MGHQKQMCVGFLTPTHGLLLLLLTNGIMTSKDPLLRLNYGVKFQPEGGTEVATNYWYHTIEVKLPQMTKELDALDQCGEKEQLVSESLRTMCKHGREILNSTLYVLKETQQKLRTLLPKKGRRRRKRSLLPKVGHLSKSLFGTAVESDLEVLQDHIQYVSRRSQKSSKIFRQHLENFASFMSTTDRRFNMLAKHVDTHNSTMGKIKKSVSVLVEEMVLMSKIMGTIGQHLKFMEMLQLEYEELIAGITDLLQGKLSPLLVSAATIDQILREVERQLNELYPALRITHMDTQFYYRTRLFKFDIDSESVLLITLKIPVAPKGSTLDIYSVTAYPVPVHPISNATTIVVSVPDFLLISRDRKYYTELAHAQLTRCHHGIGNKLCPFHLSLIPVKRFSCATAIFYQNKSQILSQCDIRYETNTVRAAINVISPRKLLMTNIADFILACPSTQETTHKGCHFCLVKIPCGCSFETADLRLPAFWQDCQRDSRSIHYSYLINLAILQGFFPPYTHIHIHPGSLFPSPRRYHLPLFRIFSHRFLRLLPSAAQGKTALELGYMIKATKEHQLIYRDLGEVILHKLYTSNLRLEPTHLDPISGIVVPIVCVLVLGPLVAVVLLYVKLSSLSQLVHRINKSQGKSDDAECVPANHVMVNVSPFKSTARNGLCAPPGGQIKKQNLRYFAEFLEMYQCDNSKPIEGHETA